MKPNSLHELPRGRADARDTRPIEFANARLILPERECRGGLTVKGGRIVDITEGTRVPAGALDCEGDCVMPGLVELHTDNLERHIEPRPAVDWPHFSAILAHDGELASTGITTVFDALRLGSLSGEPSRRERYSRALSNELLALRASGVLRISHYLHLRAEICSETLLEEFAEFTESDGVGIVSLMDHTPGHRQFRDLEKLRTYVNGKRRVNDAEFEDHVAHLVDLRSRHGEAHERGAITEARRLGAVLASHDDTTTDHVETSLANGVGFAEFPTTLEAARACRDRGIAIMMGAPNIIRGGSHSGNVSALDLAEQGLLDIVSSDYVPSALLLSAFRLGHIWQDLPRAVATVTAAPADAVGLRDRGRLHVGQRADMVRIRELDGTPVVRGVWSAGRQVG
ncbi:MAG: alpha-D-ribose 1-methylphosphonate 5-triphosphate diphosphatase [Roseovarius sp.]|nr:alpha-D-ribose 1-methylphosphonate 5-triphosphate diphosphatase [Roseovarius sp.]